jgi:hypothetical protein
VTGAQIADALGDLVPDVDRSALTGDIADYVAESCRRAVLQGVAGWRDDDLAFVRPWGFTVDTITVPVSVWHGRLDKMPPTRTASGWRRTWRARVRTCTTTKVMCRSRPSSTASSPISRTAPDSPEPGLRSGAQGARRRRPALGPWLGGDCARGPDFTPQEVFVTGADPDWIFVHPADSRRIVLAGSGQTSGSGPSRSSAHAAISAS